MPTGCRARRWSLESWIIYSRFASSSESVRYAADPALGVVRHHVVRIQDPVRHRAPRLKRFLNPTAQFGWAFRILVVTSVALIVVSPPVLLKSRRKKSPIRTRGEL